MTAEGNPAGINPKWQVGKSPVCGVVEELGANYFHCITVVRANCGVIEVPEGQKQRQ